MQLILIQDLRSSGGALLCTGQDAPSTRACVRSSSTRPMDSGLRQKRQVGAVGGASCPAAPEPLNVQLRKSCNY